MVVGSHARTDIPADRWSTRCDPDRGRPRAVRCRCGLGHEFGIPVLTFLEPTAVGDQRERRVSTRAARMSTSLIPVSALDRLESSDNATDLLRRASASSSTRSASRTGCRIAATTRTVASPTQPELTDLASDFWYHALWTAKKLGAARFYRDRVSRRLHEGAARDTAEWHARYRSVHGHVARGRSSSGGRSRAPRPWRALAHYDLRDVARAVGDDRSVPGGRGRDGSQAGLAVELDHADLRRRVAEVVPDPRGVSTLWP